MTEKVLPDKLYFKIGEVAQLAEVPTHVLRYWESEFSCIRPKRTGSALQRLYRRDDVALILTIKTMLHSDGYTIAGAKKLLEQGNQQTAEILGSHPTTTSLLKPQSALKTIKTGLLEIRKLLAKK